MCRNLHLLSARILGRASGSQFDQVDVKKISPDLWSFSITMQDTTSPKY